jgi:hypothetical protein
MATSRQPTTAVDDIDAQALKLCHANRVNYFLNAAAAASNTNNDDNKRGLAQALALRYSQAAHAEFRGVAPGQQFCDGCAGALVAGVSAAFRITTRAPLNAQGSDKMANNNNNNNYNNLELKKKKKRKLSKNAVKHLEQRQAKLRARLTAQGVEYVTRHSYQDKKTAAKGKTSLDALGRKRRWLQCTCKNCDYKTYTPIETLSTTSSSSYSAAGAASKTNSKSNNSRSNSTIIAAGEDTPAAEPAKKKRKKNSLVAKLAAQKQARSTSTGFSLGLSDFLAKK